MDSFNKFILRAYWVPGTEQDREDIKVNRTNIITSLINAPSVQNLCVCFFKLLSLLSVPVTSEIDFKTRSLY